MALRNYKCLLRKRIKDYNASFRDTLSSISPALPGASKFTWICLSTLFRSCKRIINGVGSCRGGYKLTENFPVAQTLSFLNPTVDVRQSTVKDTSCP